MEWKRMEEEQEGIESRRWRGEHRDGLASKIGRYVTATGTTWMTFIFSEQRYRANVDDDLE